MRNGDYHSTRFEVKANAVYIVDVFQTKLIRMRKVLTMGYVILFL